MTEKAELAAWRAAIEGDSYDELIDAAWEMLETIESDREAATDDAAEQLADAERFESRYGARRADRPRPQGADTSGGAGMSARRRSVWPQSPILASVIVIVLSLIAVTLVLLLLSWVGLPVARGHATVPKVRTVYILPAGSCQQGVFDRVVSCGPDLQLPTR